MFTFDQQSITASTVKYVKLLWPAVLLDDYDRAVMADIGLGKMAADQPTFASGRTPLWASPEQLVVSRLSCLPGNGHPDACVPVALQCLQERRAVIGGLEWH